MDGMGKRRNGAPKGRVHNKKISLAKKVTRALLVVAIKEEGREHVESGKGRRKELRKARVEVEQEAACRLITVAAHSVAENRFVDGRAPKAHDTLGFGSPNLLQDKRSVLVGEKVLCVLAPMACGQQQLCWVLELRARQAPHNIMSIVFTEVNLFHPSGRSKQERAGLAEVNLMFHVPLQDTSSFLKG